MVAPIALFVYKRLWHTKQTIESLRKNTLAQDSDLIVYSDGPKDESFNNDVQDVRRYIEGVTGFKSVRLVKRKENYGLSKSIILGVSEILKSSPTVIVMEDDMVTSPFMLQYFNDALIQYVNDDRVVSAHAYVYPIENLPETFFLRGADCWGWATWRRAWTLFETDGRILLRKLKSEGLLNRFDFGGNADFSGMLRNQIKGKNDSWAVRWYASALLSDGLTLYPGHSLVKNIGLDNSGTHCNASNDYNVTLQNSMVHVGNIEVTENQKVYNQFCEYLSNTSMKKSLIRKILKIFRNS